MSDAFLLIFHNADKSVRVPSRGHLHDPERIDPFIKRVFVDEPAKAGRFVADGVERAVLAQMLQSGARRARDDDALFADLLLDLRELDGRSKASRFCKSKRLLFHNLTSQTIQTNHTIRTTRR